MLILLLACAKPPRVTFPVTIPTVENGAAMPAITYVQPAVTTLDDTALCGEPDVRGYLADGSFGWRVLELRDDGPFGPTGEPLVDLAPRWRAADARVTEVCGTHERGAVLLVAERTARFRLVNLEFIRGQLPDTDLHLLVADPSPGVLVPARPGAGGNWLLDVRAWTWVVLPLHDAPAGEFHRRTDAVSMLARARPSTLLLHVEKPTWAKVADELDALAPHGLRPTFHPSMRRLRRRSTPTPVQGHVEFGFIDTLAVLPLEVDGPQRPLSDLLRELQDLTDQDTGRAP